MAEDLTQDEDEARAEQAMATLRAALAVAPSPDFADRVRLQVAQHPRPQGRPGWILLAAAAVVLIAAGALAWRLRPAPASVQPSVASVAPTPAGATPLPTRPEPPPVRTQPPPRFAAERAEARVAGPAQRPPVRVLVPRGERERLARYVALNRRRPRTAESLPEIDPGAPLAEPAAIVIAALDVAPVVTPEGSFR